MKPDFIKEDKINYNNSTSVSNITVIEEKKLERIKLFNCPEGLIESILLQNSGFIETTINKDFIKDDNFTYFFKNKPQSIWIDTYTHKFDEYFELKELEIEKDLFHVNSEEILLSDEIQKNINTVENQKILDFFIFRNEFVDIVKDIPIKLSIDSKSESNNQAFQYKSNEFGNLNTKSATKTKKNKSKKEQIKQKKMNELDNSDSLEEVVFPDSISSNNQDENANSISYISNINNTDLKLSLTTNRFTYDENWWSKISFECHDATKYKSFTNEKNEHFTHIYTYNKIMGEECSSKIAKILNKTNFLVLAWYLTPKQSEKAGLKNVLYLCSFPMHTTSTEKFNVYIYIKTR